MNKKGFTLVELLATIIIIAIIMTLVLPSAFRVSNNNKLKIYEEYEKVMVEYAMVSELNSRNKIKLTELEELEKVKSECSGYVLINHNSSPVLYTAYISCGDQYETEGFDSSYLNN